MRYKRINPDLGLFYRKNLHRYTSSSTDALSLPYLFKLYSQWFSSNIIIPKRHWNKLKSLLAWPSTIYTILMFVAVTTIYLYELNRFPLIQWLNVSSHHSCSLQGATAHQVLKLQQAHLYWLLRHQPSHHKLHSVAHSHSVTDCGSREWYF